MLNRPVILIVDDDPSALTTMLDALARRYGGDYRVTAQLTAAAAIKDLERMKKEGEQVALVITDQWMPEMTGIELLDRVHAIHPGAQRALLVEWGDRTATHTIIEGCAFQHIENYLQKPWSPPEIYLYPQVGEFLADWTRAHGPRMELVRVIGCDPLPRAHELREVLSRNGIPHGYYLADSDEGRDLLAKAQLDDSRLPVVTLLDGRALVDPSNSDVLDALGATTIEDPSCDVVIVGGGPAGLAAAVNTASEGLRTIVVEREAIGGQAGTSSLIRNYLGFPRGISGAELAQRAYDQAWLFDAKFVFARKAKRLRTAGADRILQLADGTEIRARTVIIATGAHYRRVGIESLERFVGANFFYSVPADALFMKGKDAVVIGGGNSAGQAATHLAKYARRVLLLVRGESLTQTMSDYLLQLLEHLPNVEIRLHTELVSGDGDGKLQNLTFRCRNTGRAETVTDHVVFAQIGAQPHTRWLADQVARDEHGFIYTGTDAEAALGRQLGDRRIGRFETSLPGVFAVGDVRHGSVKRVASAAGEGAMVVQAVHDYLASLTLAATA
jgi:thioredoxin reductase (NADPH)